MPGSGKSTLGQALSQMMNMGFLDCDKYIEHREGQTLQQIIDSSGVEEFRKIDVLYVADGHHRSASACRVRELRRDQNPHHSGEEEYNYFLGVVFPHNQMKIMAYNRVIKDLHGLSFDHFLDKVRENFIVTDMAIPVPQEPKCYGLYSTKGWLALTAKEGRIPLMQWQYRPIREFYFQLIYALREGRRV